MASVRIFYLRTKSNLLSSLFWPHQLPELSHNKIQSVFIILDLDKTKHEAESMKAQLREKDALIDNLQFKLFWVESDMNDAREGLDVESDLQPLRPRENVTRTTSVRGGVQGAMVRRVEFAPGEENMKTPIRPRTYQFDSAEKEMVAASQGRGSDKPRKRSSFFSGLFKSKKSIFNMSGTSTRRRRRSF